MLQSNLPLLTIAVDVPLNTVNHACFPGKPSLQHPVYALTMNTAMKWRNCTNDALHLSRPGGAAPR